MKDHLKKSWAGEEKLAVNKMRVTPEIWMKTMKQRVSFHLYDIIKKNDTI